MEEKGNGKGSERTFKIEFGPAGEVTFRINPDEILGIPRETIHHLREANRQGLLALRSFLDRVIEHLDPKEESSSGPIRIEVEVEEEPEQKQS